MKLYIEKCLDNTLYNLIKIDEKSHSCLLQDTLENCIELFKKTISGQEVPKGISFSYDSSTHVIMDYTSGSIIAIDEKSFSNYKL